MIGKEDNKYLLNVIFNALSFLLAPLAECGLHCSGVPDYPHAVMTKEERNYKDKNVVGNSWASVARELCFSFLFRIRTLPSVP